jgi:hypothetical protein
MADHTESSLTGIRPARTFLGSSPIEGYPESASQSFRYGQCVQFDENGGTNAHRIEVMSSLSTSILGVAGDAASSLTGTLIPVYLADPDNRFYGWVKETILSTMLGQDRSIVRDSSKNIDYLAVNSTAAEQRVQITKIGIESLAGGPYNINDSNGYVEFKFLGDFTTFGKST